MKLYVFPLAPNPRKVLIYLKEKQLDVPLETVDLMSGQNRTPEFLKKNPLGGLPVLQLDDGSHLTESLAIIEYFEDLHPEPSMLGKTPIERARVREAERIIELGVLGSIGTIFQNTSPLFAGRIKQVPDAAENAKTRLANSLKVVDDRLAKSTYAAGEKPSIADCTLFAAVGFAEFAGVPLDAAAYPNIARWHEHWKQRPSAQG